MALLLLQTLWPRFGSRSCRRRRGPPSRPPGAARMRKARPRPLSPRKPSPRRPAQMKEGGVAPSAFPAAPDGQGAARTFERLAQSATWGRRCNPRRLAPGWLASLAWVGSLLPAPGRSCPAPSGWRAMLGETSPLSLQLLLPGAGCPGSWGLCYHPVGSGPLSFISRGAAGSAFSHP